MSTETCPRIIESPFRSLARGDSWNAGKPPSTFPNCVSTSSSPISLAGTATEQMLLSSPLDPLVTHAKPSRTVDKHPHALGVGHLAGGVPEVELVHSFELVREEAGQMRCPVWRAWGAHREQGQRAMWTRRA